MRSPCSWCPAWATARAVPAPTCSTRLPRSISGSKRVRSRSRSWRRTRARASPIARGRCVRIPRLRTTTAAAAPTRRGTSGANDRDGASEFWRTESMKVRRVTTGHDAAGKAIVASDTIVDGTLLSMLPGAEFHRLWGADRPPSFPDDGSPAPAATYFPPLGGFRFMMFTVAPLSTAQRAAMDRGALAAEMQAKLPGLAEYMEPSSPGMHTTDTIDFEYIISGEVWLELDDGVSVHLRA